MMDNPSPTRAEVTDVYYAAQSGTDATMLSGESASGDFPYESVETMARINLEAERNFDYLQAFTEGYANVRSENAESAYDVARTALVESVDYIIAFSEKGRLINALSRMRTKSPVLALVKDKDLVTKYGPYYAIYAQYHANLNDYKSDVKVKAIAKKAGIKPGSKVLVAIKDEYRTIKV